MANFRRPFKCEVLTPARSVLSCDATSVTYPASDGQMGVLASRSAMVTMLGAGMMTVKTIEGEDLQYFLAGGFAASSENNLLLLADECELIEKLDRDEAWEQLERVRKLPADTDKAYELKCELLETARKKFNLIQVYNQKKKQQARKRMQEKLNRLKEG